MFLLLERGEGRGKGKERNINVWQIHPSVASHLSPLGTWPATQACVLTGNRTNISVHSLALDLLSHTSQGTFYLFIFRQRGKEGQRQRNMNVWLPLESPIGDLAHNPHMCLDWELNHDHLVHRLALNLIRQSSQSYIQIFLIVSKSLVNCNLLIGPDHVGCFAPVSSPGWSDNELS